MTSIRCSSFQVRRKPLVIVVAMVVPASAGALTACNTTEGAGKDIKSVGKGIEEAAHDNK